MTADGEAFIGIDAAKLRNAIAVANAGRDLARLRPPTVTDAEKALRRAVPMAYRISL
jgi:hypothetical protein